LLIESYPFLSLVPPLLAIILAVYTRQVYLSLFAGIVVGTTVLADGHLLKGIADAIEACVLVFKDAGNTRVIIFVVLVGALIALLQRSGGIEGFTTFVSQKGIVRGKRSVELTAFIIGVVIFIESSITCLVTGTIARPLTDKYKISREKLAYICDSTSAPICALIPLNAWGAYIITLLAKEGLSEPVGLFLSSILLNFYALAALILLLIIILFQCDFGPMRKATQRAEHTGKVLRDGAQPAIAEEVTHIIPKPGTTPLVVNMLVPMGVMIITIFAGLYITGDGHLTRGSGSTSVLWAVCTAIFSAALLYKSQNLMDFDEIVKLFFKGTGGLMGLLGVKLGPFNIIVITSLINFKQTPVDQTVTHGLYRFSRNPQWVGMVLVFLGEAFAVASWLHLGLLLILVMAYHFQILTEEEACMGFYGEEYQDYMSQVPRYLLWR